jgi:hypothetical protein
MGRGWTTNNGELEVYDAVRGGAADFLPVRGALVRPSLEADGAVVTGVVAVQPTQDRGLREAPLDTESASWNVSSTKSLLYRRKVDAKERADLLGREDVCAGFFGRDAVAGVQLEVDEVRDQILLGSTGRTDNLI